VLRHQLGQNLLLRLDLLLQVCNPLLVSGMVGWPFLLEGSSSVLEEFLLPAVEDRRLEPHFIAQLRDGLLLQQVPPQDGDLLFRSVLLPLLLHALSPFSLMGERLLHFQLNRNIIRSSSQYKNHNRLSR
jgi:hypothetical protein